MRGVATAGPAREGDGAASTVIAFMDGDGADRGDLIDEIARPVLDGAYDLVLASRTRGERDPGSMLWHQVLAGRIAGWGMRRTVWDATATCAPSGRSAETRSRVSRTGNDLRLEYRDANEGGAGSLRILEVPLPYRRRAGGSSKVAGSLRGTLRATGRIASTFVRVATQRAPV